MMKTRQDFDKKKGLVVLLSAVCSAVLAIGALPASAADFTVTTDVDELTTNGLCSLREAIVNANDNALTYPDCPAGEAGPAVDVINLPAGTYTLTLDGVDERCDGATPCTGTTDAYVPVVTYDASQGDLDITDDVTITGAGSDVTRIEWTPTSPGVPLAGDDDPLTGDRIFQVSTTSSSTADIASVVIQGLTVVNGEVGLKPTKAVDVCVPDGPLPSTTTYDDTQLNAYDIEVIENTCGLMDAEGKLDVLDTSIVIDQFRRMGGAIALGGGYATVHYDSKLEGLPPVVESGGEGSSFAVEHATLDDVVVVNNWSGGDGGGIHSIVPATISQSKISGNTSDGGNGGGLYNEGNTVISDTLIGKEFDAAADPELTNRNSAENGGAIFFTGAPQTTTTIVRSAINGNYAIGGGGLAGREATFDVTNTTISSNEARDLGAGIITSGPVYLQNVTVADNLATTPASSGGAGLNGFSNAIFYLSNTLLANNLLVYPGKPTRYDNCGVVGSNAEFISQGYNLEDGDTCGFDTSFHFDQVYTDPLLEPLADNGGPTETQLIPHTASGGAVDSPAVDAGDCPSITNDQRGSIRPVDGDGDMTAKCDIGAFELFNLTPDLQISSMVAPDQVYIGNQFTVVTGIANGSPNPDTAVLLVTDALPAGVTFVGASATGGSDNTCSEAAGVVTCSIGDLEATSFATVTLTLSSTAVSNATIAANASSTTEDGTEANNSASVTIAIIALPSGGGGGSGWCSYNPDARFDPVLPGLVLAALAYLGWKLRRKGAR